MTSFDNQVIQLFLALLEDVKVRNIEGNKRLGQHFCCGYMLQFMPSIHIK